MWLSQQHTQLASYYCVFTITVKRRFYRYDNCTSDRYKDYVPPLEHCRPNCTDKVCINDAFAKADIGKYSQLKVLLCRYVATSSQCSYLASYDLPIELSTQCKYLAINHQLGLFGYILWIVNCIIYCHHDVAICRYEHDVANKIMITCCIVNSLC